MKNTYQPSLFDGEQPIKTAHRTIVYEPPTIQDVDRYAHAVCRTFAQRTHISPDTETTRGFAAFIRAIVSITLHSLNDRDLKHKIINGGQHAAR